MLLPLASILTWVQDKMSGDAGYSVLFGLLLSCGLGVPLPEDIPLLLAGYFVADGKMNLVAAAVFAWLGIIGGDCCLYGLGRRFGMGITKIPVIGSHVSKERIDQAHEMFEKYGVWVVAVGRLFAGIRGAMVITAGAIRFTFLHFIIADGFAAILSGGLFMGLGYYGRKKLGGVEQIRVQIEKYQRLILLALVVSIICFALWKWTKSKRKAKEKPVSNDA